MLHFCTLSLVRIQYSEKERKMCTEKFRLAFEFGLRFGKGEYLQNLGPSHIIYDSSCSEKILREMALTVQEDLKWTSVPFNLSWSLNLTW